MSKTPEQIIEQEKIDNALERSRNINIRKYELCGHILGVLQSVEETFNNYNMPRSSENITKHIEMLNELIKILKREDNIIY